MCKQCVIFGALLNAGERKFATDTLARYDFAIAKSSAHIDKHAKIFLADTLAAFRNLGIYFEPVLVDSDGSCLPHSISRCLVGSEVFYDALRSDLYDELLIHAEWYKDNLPIAALLDKEEMERIWKQDYLDSAKPTRGKR